MTINDSIKSIKERIINTLKEDEYFKKVNIISGATANVMPKPPNLHIVFSTANCDLSHTGLMQYWILNVSFVSIVNCNKKVEEASDFALDLVSNAFNKFIHNELLTCGQIYDIVPVSLDSNSTEVDTKNGLLASAQSTIQIKFWVE